MGWVKHTTPDGIELDGWQVEAVGDYPEVLPVTIQATVGQVIVADHDDEGNPSYFVIDGPVVERTEEEVLADLAAEAEEPHGKPGGNDSAEDWFTYRNTHGYTVEELEGLNRNDLRDLEDR
jgi:hypothetical protein